MWLYIHVLSCIYDNDEKYPECITLFVIQHSKKMEVADSITKMCYRTTHSASFSCELYVSTLGQLFDVSASVTTHKQLRWLMVCCALLKGRKF